MHAASRTGASAAATAEWTQAHDLHGRVVVVVDHGAAHEGLYLRRHGVGVIFAGPHQTADDVIANDVGYFSEVQRRDAIVVAVSDGQLGWFSTPAERALRP